MAPREMPCKAALCSLLGKLCWLHKVVLPVSALHTRKHMAMQWAGLQAGGVSCREVGQAGVRARQLRDVCRPDRPTALPQLHQHVQRQHLRLSAASDPAQACTAGANTQLKLLCSPARRCQQVRTRPVHCVKPRACVYFTATGVTALTALARQQDVPRSHLGWAQAWAGCQCGCKPWAAPCACGTEQELPRHLQKHAACTSETAWRFGSAVVYLAPALASMEQA